MAQKPLGPDEDHWKVVKDGLRPLGQHLVSVQDLLSEHHCAHAELGSSEKAKVAEGHFLLDTVTDPREGGRRGGAREQERERCAWSQRAKAVPSSALASSSCSSVVRCAEPHHNPLHHLLPCYQFVHLQSP